MTIPAELRELPQWVCWRAERRGGKPTKVPVDPHNGGTASSTDPSTWSSFDDAVAAAERHGCNGVGFVFSKTDPYAGVDLDDCIDQDNPLGYRGTADHRGSRLLHGDLAAWHGSALRCVGSGSHAPRNAHPARFVASQAAWDLLLQRVAPPCRSLSGADDLGREFGARDEGHVVVTHG